MSHQKPVMIIDCETTGTKPELGHSIWDLAIIEYGAVRGSGLHPEHQWFLKPDLTKADEVALGIGGYYRRTAGLLPPLSRKPGPKWSDPAKAAAEVAPLLDGTIIIAANPDFDTKFFRAFLRSQGHAGTWDYHLQDAGSLVSGWIRGRMSAFDEVQAGRQMEIPPLGAKIDVLARAVGVEPDGSERHTAPGDCHLLAAILDVITGSPS